ncbi:hypothetical protein PFISCL1PPCAC_19648 [Pristionchus fissidentatus]|uniref:Phosphatase 2A Regulatory Subunit A helical domain-containing protein n=1 Tax=Pristionchus fissidentatus TaxID=1538716 RepID=A0AAV5W804_9BILA|nr:hypothetical protein PFISCL1PPCAC_19648 [Pristionchus fissidentatus]
MFGNGNRTSQSFSMMQLALEDDSEYSFLCSEMFDGDEDERLVALTTKEVKQLAKMAESQLVNEREAASREVCKVLRYVDTLACPKLAEEVFQVVDLLARDQASSVQCCLLEGMSVMLSMCQKSSVLAPFAPSILTPLLVRTLTTTTTDNVRKNAIGIVGLLLEQSLLPQECLLSSILPTLFSLCSIDTSPEAHTYIADEQRVESASVLCRSISSGIVKDRDWILSNFVPKYSYLLADSVFHIRKAAVTILGDLCKMFGEKFCVEFALPHTVVLGKDDMWGVRKAICEVFVDVAIFCPQSLRRSTLAPLFIGLLRDTSRWVSYIAFQELGPFISTFANSAITGLMIKDGQVIRRPPNGLGEEEDKKEAEERAKMVCKELPPGCYVPEMKEKMEENEKDELDETVALEQLLGELNEEREKITSRCRSEENLIGGHGVSSKCHSLDDLSLIGLDNLMEIEPDIVSEREESMVGSPPSSEDAFYSNIYWGSYTLNDEYLAAFGTNAVSSPRRAKNEEMMGRRSEVMSRKETMEKKEEKRIEVTEEEKEEKMEVKEIDIMEGEDREEIVPVELVEHFIKMVSGPSSDAADMNRQCAHNFPAVAFTLGTENWNNLRETYTTLSKDHQWRVRVSLAHSIHEMATIIGLERAEQDLVPVFDALREDVDEVRGGLLKNLAHFIKNLPISARLSMLNKLPHFLRMDREGETNWRFRLEFAKQCTLLCELYPVEAINGTIAGIALTLATDRVSDVRVEASRLMARIVHLMVEEEWKDKESTTESEDTDDDMPLTNGFVRDIVKGFALSQRWSRRQTFVHMVEECRYLLTESQLSCLFLSETLDLVKDSVPNVRIVVARALTPPLTGGVWSDRVKATLEILKEDSDMDVARQARIALGFPPEKEMIDISSRALRLAEKECSQLNMSSSDMSISPNNSLLSP